MSSEAETQVQTSTYPFQLHTFIKWVAGCIKNIFLWLLCDRVQVGPDKQPVVKTVGPLTDADVIKLRPCEKKKVGLSPPSLLCGH